VKFELLINLKPARTIGLPISESILLRLTLLGGAAATWAFTLRAQQRDEMRRAAHGRTILGALAELRLSFPSPF
jgi:hypothetical protein